jgi:hypothetical protein
MGGISNSSSSYFTIHEQLRQLQVYNKRLVGASRKVVELTDKGKTLPPGPELDECEKEFTAAWDKFVAILDESKKVDHDVKTTAV